MTSPRFVAVAVVVLFLLAATFLLRFLARSMIYPGSAVAFPSQADLTRRYPDARLLHYRSEDGAPLAGVLLRRPGSAAPVVVAFHGNAESAAQNLPQGEELQRRGLDVFLPEVRGYGGLAGRPTESHLYQDGEAALETLAGEGVPAEQVVLVGRSLGSGIATELAVRRPCGLLVLVSPFTSMVDMGKQLVGPLASITIPDHYDNRAKISRVRCPVVILHGTADEVIPMAMGKALSQAAPGIKFIEVPGASHNDFPELEERLASEILSALRSRGAVR